jgi:hypothetical protein
MRTTSKIIVGGYLLITILTLIYIIVQSRVPAEKIFQFSLANDRIERKELPPFKVFKLRFAHRNLVGNIIELRDAKLTISQSETNVSSFDIAETFESTLSIITTGDTLICNIVLPDTIKKIMKEHEFFYLQKFHCNLSLPKGSSTFVHNDIESFATNIEKVQFESLSLESNDAAYVTSSDITNFSFHGTNWSQLNVEVVKSTIQNYNLNLDDVARWDIKESRVGKLNLSSDKQIRITSIPYSMCDEVTYTPKNKDASLSVKLKSPTTLISHDK